MQRKLDRAIQALFEKKAEGALLLDLREGASFTDYFPICQSTSRRHIQAIADHVIEALHQEGDAPLGTEGYLDANWVLIDYGDIIIHIFSREKRAYYQLEKLWGNVPMRELSDSNIGDTGDGSSESQTQEQESGS